MARFLGGVNGGRGEVTRLGHKSTGIEARAQGWNVGARVTVTVGPDGRDLVRVYRTGGSIGYEADLLIAEFHQDAEREDFLYLLEPEGVTASA